jgi:hypothetical protein
MPSAQPSSPALPGFTPEGMLPPGDYPLSIDELRNSMLVLGPGPSYEHWDVGWRRKLVDNLGVLTGQLCRLGITEIYIDGSFVEDKDHPNDIDGYFECDRRLLTSGQLVQNLNLFDPHKSWSWDPKDRRLYPGSPKAQLPMWHRYRVELYPHCPGLLCGIRDEYNNDLEFPAAFRKSRRDGKRRGIVKLTGVHGHDS